MATLIKKEHFQNVWTQINRILALKDADGNRTSLSDLTDYNFGSNLKINSKHISDLNKKIEEMKSKDVYYKEDTSNYLITYSGSTSSTIKDTLNTYLNNLKTSASLIVCRNLFTNSNGLKSYGTKSNGTKDNGTYSYGQSENISGHQPANSNNMRTAKTGKCEGGSCSYGTCSDGTKSNENHNNQPCPQGTKVDIYCNNKGG